MATVTDSPEPSTTAVADASAAIPPPTDREGIFDVFRRWGYLEADLDPLDRLPPVRHPELRLGGEEAEAARNVYCGALGVEFMHLPDPRRREWIQERLESESKAAPTLQPEDVLDRLIAAETFEQVLQSRYLGTKRFSLEGVTALLPLLDELLEGVAGHGGRQVVIAMSHRGRLNVMHYIVGVDTAAILAGFEDVDPRSVLGGGDVKYHLGATGKYETRGGESLAIHLVSNPSHLDAVDPVAVGRVRAKQQRFPEDERTKRVVPVLLHGDAAFAGQGIAAETLNLQELPGFGVGGTIHVIVNNLIGFTTEPYQLHSSRFSSDIAKRLPVPVLHVNGEVPEAVLRAARIAIDYRSEFGTDVVLDLLGYRRHGHSEVDDPTITQPRLYALLDEHPPLWKIYAERLGVSEEETKEKVDRLKEEMNRAQEKASEMSSKPKIATLPSYWDDYVGGYWKPEHEVETKVSAEELEAVTDAITRLPDGFHPHAKIEKLLELRREMGSGDKSLDYGMAEHLAFGTLLRQGIPVRVSGQDSRRATFAQRHAVLVDVEDDHDHYPLQALAEEGDTFFEIYDSMLSEAAVLGFEYGFSRDYPEALVCWEAQFGDFANGAQVILDQFVTAGEDKWGLLSGLTLLLPHGYEGQGPEHSSARMERYLQLCAEHNIQVAQPSTAGQYFHLLRRQALRKWRKPLVVLTPKSMLRHKDSASDRKVLTDGRFRTVVPDDDVADADRILICTGKIGHELKREREKRDADRIAVVFVDQLYPFPEEELGEELSRHGDAREICWVQEEPANMGALFFVLPHLERLARGRRVRTFKRSASGSPATGSAKAHQMEQKTLLSLPFELAPSARG